MLFNSFQPGSFRRKIARNVFFLFAVLCFSAVLLFTGCDTKPDDEPGILTGIWTDEWVNVIISDSTIKYGDSYEGNIVNSPDLKAKNGILIIKFTDYVDVWGTGEVVPENINKYGALYWTNLTDKSVNMSDAGTGGMSDYEHTMFETKAEAEAEFTLDKAGVYASLGGAPFTKK